MAGQSSRKSNERVREVVAEILAQEISDPRLELVTVTGVDVSGDRSVAEVFVIAHGDDERYTEVLEGLTSARGRIRSLLGHALGWRTTPELRFHIDPSVDAALRIAEALQHVPPTLAAHEEDGDEG